MRKGTLSFSVTSSFVKLDPEHPSDALLIVLHGYGQLAEFFIRKFEPLLQDNWTILAPQGLSKFYLEGFSGKVGASWMTKEDREIDIQNQLSYLNALYLQECTENNYKKIVVLGFSQGAATASRWLTIANVTFDQLILWAGIFPNDLDASLSKKRLEGKKLDLVFGDKDPFVTEERMENQKTLITDAALPFEIHSFEGKHDIDIDTLKKVLI